MIKPQIGMPVLYHVHDDDHFAGGRLLAAVIVRVWTDSCVNLTIFDGNGVTQNRTSVLLWQGADGEVPPGGGRWGQFPGWFVRLMQCEPPKRYMGAVGPL